jgi:RNA-splicing ligase RtcB
MESQQSDDDKGDPQRGALGPGGGAGVRNGLPLPVDSSGPRRPTAGSGAAPLMATTTESGDEGLEQQDADPASQPKSPRMNWTREMNISLMRAYFTVTKLGARKRGFRTEMLTEFRRLQPTAAEATERQISNQQHAIKLKDLLSPAEINTIREAVKQDLEAVQAEMQMQVPDDAGADQELEEERIQLNENKKELEEVRPQQEVAWADEFETMKLLWNGISYDMRPRIPRVDYSPWTFCAVKNVDEVLRQDLESATGLEEVVSLVHCAALTTAKILGKRIGAPSSNQAEKGKPKVKEEDPPWKRRLDRKISRLRQEIGQVTAYLQDMNSAKKQMKNKVKTIAWSCRTKEDKVNPKCRKDMKRVLEILKQRLAAFANRIRRYSRAEKRRQSNNLFEADQRRFYRQMGGEKEELVAPAGEVLEEFWRNIWSTPKTHNEDAFWIKEEEELCRDIPEMWVPQISTEMIRKLTQKLHNWKAPGTDGIQNFWWKHLSSTHGVLSKWFQMALADPKVIPESFTEGVTYMLPKAGDPMDPKNRRPITCLRTVYKIFTAVVGNLVCGHLEVNKLLAPEQNGCRRGTQGCKELLVIDGAVVNQVRKSKRNLSVAWIDYKKAFDSIPHSWLIKILVIYKVHPQIVKVLEHCMKTWRTRLRIPGERGCCTSEIPILRGIFQGDAFSPKWFCIGLNPLSRMIRHLLAGYKLTPQLKITHLFYMDDLKTFAANREQQRSQLETVKRFSDDICMEFGVDKCAVVHVQKGEVQEPEQVTLMCGTAIQALGKEDAYKYLGIHQLLDTDVIETRKAVQKKVVERVTKLCKAMLTGKNLIKAINTWAVPVAVYTFGVLNWSRTALRMMDQRIRTVMGDYGAHYSRSSMTRLYLKRRNAGRGLLNLEEMCADQVERLRMFFKTSQLELHKGVCKVDEGLTPLRLADGQYSLKVATEEQRRDEWEKEKVLHMQFANALKEEHVDLKASTDWLDKGGLFAETEAFVFAIQDRILRTRSYQRYIMKDKSVKDECRLCKAKGETIEHIVAGCSTLSLTDYLARHNDMAKVVHQGLAKECGLVEKEEPYYIVKPETVLENEQYKLLWDMSLQTDRAVEANRPDLVWVNKKEKKAFIVDIAVPLDKNVVSTMAEKRRKYQPLAFELKQVWQLSEVVVVPLVMSVNGLVPNEFSGSVERLGLKKWHIQSMQKAVLLGTTRIVRKFLGV